MTREEAKGRLAENERLYKDAVDRRDWAMAQTLMDEFRKLNNMIILSNMPHLRERS